MYANVFSFGTLKLVFTFSNNYTTVSKVIVLKIVLMLLVKISISGKPKNIGSFKKGCSITCVSMYAFKSLASKQFNWFLQNALQAEILNQHILRFTRNDFEIYWKAMRLYPKTWKLVFNSVENKAAPRVFLLSQNIVEGPTPPLKDCKKPILYWMPFTNM